MEKEGQHKTESGKQAQLNAKAMATPSPLLCVLYLQSHATQQHGNGYGPHSLWVSRTVRFLRQPQGRHQTFLL